MRFGLRISPVAARAGECPLTETDSGCSAGEAKLVFLPHLRHSPRRTSVSGCVKPGISEISARVVPPACRKRSDE